MAGVGSAAHETQLKEFPADCHFEERPLAGGADVAFLPVELKAASSGFVALFPL